MAPVWVSCAVGLKRSGCQTFLDGEEECREDASILRELAVVDSICPNSFRHYYL